MADVQPAIRVERVSKRYTLGTGVGGSLSQALDGAIRRPFRRRSDRPEPGKEFWAVRDVSLEVNPGEVFGVIGRNGSGKSTLLKLLSQITSPTEGLIEMRGRVGTLLEVGTGFHPELSGRENVFLNGTVLGMKRLEIAARYEEITEFAGISEEFLETPVKRYSSGMYVRLAFAVAAHLQPEILLVDEVLAVGDLDFQRKCIGKMDEVAESGRTVVLVSHNLGTIERLCTRTAWLDGGRLVELGSTRDVIAAYTKTSRPVSTGGESVVPANASRHGEGEARLTRLRMLDEGGKISDELRLGRGCSFEMSFQVREPIRQVIVMVAVCAGDGTRIFTAISVDDAGGEALDLAPGEHVVRVDLQPLNLLPGEYTVDVGIHELERRPYDYVERVLEFTATNAPLGDPEHYPWQSSYGYARPDSRWSFESPVSETPAVIDTRAGHAP